MVASHGWRKGLRTKLTLGVAGDSRFPLCIDSIVLDTLTSKSTFSPHRCVIINPFLLTNKEIHICHINMHIQGSYRPWWMLWSMSIYKREKRNILSSNPVNLCPCFSNKSCFTFYCYIPLFPNPTSYVYPYAFTTTV